MVDDLNTSTRIQCDICNGRHTYTNKRNHFNTILHQNALLKLRTNDDTEVQPVTSIECDICSEHYWITSKQQHEATNKHIRALQIKINSDV